jgi:hypothetical protein
MKQLFLISGLIALIIALILFLDSRDPAPQIENDQPLVQNGEPSQAMEESQDSDEPQDMTALEKQETNLKQLTMKYTLPDGILADHADAGGFSQTTFFLQASGLPVLSIGFMMPVDEDGELVNLREWADILGYEYEFNSRSIGGLSFDEYSVNGERRFYHFFEDGFDSLIISARVYQEPAENILETIEFISN